MNLFEDIYYELLTEGKSPEEILSMLKYKFKDIPEKVIDDVFSIDPTKKKSYTQWVLLHWKNEKHIIDNALKTGKLRKLFEYLQKTPDTQLSKYNTLEDALYLVSEIDLLDKDGDGPENDFDIVYKSSEWIIAVPNTYEASHKLGENTDWCTAGYKYRDGEGYYDNYLRQYGGKYFINFDLRSSEHLNGIDYPFKRYQFHFESHQFMDATDTPVTLDEIDMPQNVIEFYESKGYSFNDMNREEREEGYRIDRFDDGICISQDNELWILQEYDHDNLELTEDGGNYMVYQVNYDEMDPIDYQTVSKKPLYVNDGAEIYILNTSYHDAINDVDYGDLKVYSSEESDCVPMVIVPQHEQYSKFECVDDISYYKIFELFGKEILVYIGNGDSRRNGTSNRTFNIIGSGHDIAVTLPFNSSFNVSDIEINFDVQGLYNSYESDFLLEVIWESGYHTLLNIYNTNDCDIIIKGDKPANNEKLFTIEQNSDGDYIVPAVFRNYNVDELDDETTGNTISHFDSELFYKDMVSVVMNNKKLNVFDREKKKLVFDDGFDSFILRDDKKQYIDDLGVIIGKRNNKYAFYSLDTGEQLTDVYDVIDIFRNRKYFGACNGDPKTTHEFYIINYKLKTFGPFFRLTSDGTDNKVLVVVIGDNNTDGGKRVLNLNTGEIENDNLTRLTSLRNYMGYPILLAQNENGEIICYNYETNQIIDRDIMINRKPSLFTKDVGLNEYVVFRHSSTGKENIVSLIDGSKLLPQDVDRISTEHVYSSDDYDRHHSTISHFIAFTNGNTEYLLDAEKKILLPSEDGITTGATTGIWNYRLINGKPWIMFKIHDSKVSPEIYVTYNYYTNEIFATLNPTENNRILKLFDPEIQQRVMQAIYPKKAFVTNNFNEMIKRMKDLLW